MKQEIDVLTDTAKSLLTVNLSKIPDKNSYMNLYNASGKLIRHMKINEQITSVDIKSLPPGSYILIFITGRKRQAVRFMKE